MKPRFQHQRNRGLTFFEVLVVIAIVFVLVVMFLLLIVGGPQLAPRINFVSNAKQINLPLRIWEGDNNKYPLAVSITNGGAMKTTATGDVINCFFVMSNELSTPKILICPADDGLATNRLAIP